jgi:hypothetical protein
MIKSTLKIGLAVLLLSFGLLGSILSVFSVNPVQAVQATCPEGNGWTKVDSDDLSLYPVDGATDYCFKSGSGRAEGCEGGIFDSIPEGGFVQPYCGLSHWSYFIPEGENEEYDLPSMQSRARCSEAQLRFKNPTPFFFSFDYRVDSEAGHDDGVTGLNIANGPWAGQPFGQRYNEVDVLAGTQETVNLNFPEDSGTHLVEYRLWRGAENDWYLDWESIQVESDCEENEVKDPVKASTLGYNLVCSESDFTVDMDLTEDGQPVAGILVNFSYNGLNASDTTDAGGRAIVSFPAQGNYTVQANPDGGYPSKSLEVHMPENCPAGETQVGGQVLGASTLASTGSGEELALAGQIALLFSGQAGLALLLKKKLFA